MHRREFLKLSAVAGLLASGWPGGLRAQDRAEPHRIFDRYFIDITRGFLRNAKNTSADFVACDFPEGTKIKGCCTPSGKTYTSVARMLPAIAEFVAARPDETTIEGVDLREVMFSFFRHAFDPNHPDYWGEPPKDRATQRSVEAAMIAESLWRSRDWLVDQLTPQQRMFIQNWLASCTVLPERATNHAWFSALNQAARLQLAAKWPEFKGDEAWMLADLAALDALFVPGNDGWYSDDPKIPIYDYYNFWTFGNFPLFWSRMIGERYPEWNEKFRSRAKLFMEKTPYFFASNGAHPLMGRSLIYRWALLSPMLLGYEQNLWPHSPGMLRRIVRLSFGYHWNLGAYDEKLGKLRETYSSEGTPDVKEAYIDNGHPYWAMQVFTMFAIPPGDPFWTEKEEMLPVEKEDFAVRFEGAAMMVVGAKRSGHVRWFEARNSPKRPIYRDKYTKLGYSSHFPFCVILKPAEKVPWDSALVIREVASGKCAGREGVTEGRLTDDGFVTKWWTTLNDWRFDVLTSVRIDDEFEVRTHEISVPIEALGKVEVVEGSYAYAESSRVRTWNLLGYERVEVVNDFGEASGGTSNLIHPRFAVNSLLLTLNQATVRVASIHYASPNPLADDILQQRAEKLGVAPRA